MCYYLTIAVAGGVACFHEQLSYAGWSITPGRVIQARQTEVREPEKARSNLFSSYFRCSFALYSLISCLIFFVPFSHLCSLVSSFPIAWLLIMTKKELCLQPECISRSWFDYCHIGATLIQCFRSAQVDLDLSNYLMLYFHNFRGS